MSASGELKKKAESVKNSYPEYIFFVMKNDEEYGIGDEVIEYIDHNPECSSGMVMKFIADKLDFKPLKIIKDQ